MYTTATRRAATRMLGISKLDGFFEVVVGGDEVDEPKPSPAGLELACRKLGVHPTEAIYVGDAEVDLLCAAAAGAQPVLASWDTRKPADVVRLALQKPYEPQPP